MRSKTWTELPGTQVSRRQFMKHTIAAGMVLGTRVAALAEAEGKDMPYRTLGRTGQKVSAIGLGGFHIGIPEEAVAIRMIRSAVDQGITFMDNCWDYHNGDSEVRMGKALRDGYRARVFLMTKIDGQTKALAATQIDESLRRLQTDHVDLMQFHEVIRMGDPARIFGPGGSMEAILEAQKAGKVRYIGFTGHKDPTIHLKMLETARKHRFHFDAVQMPLNVMDAHFRSFQHLVLPVLLREEIGVLGMKPLGSGHILQSHAVGAVECLHYAMNLPTSTVITGIDRPEFLSQALQAARTFEPMSSKAVAALLARTENHARAGQFEPFKTGTSFDGTVHNPQWLG